MKGRMSRMVEALVTWVLLSERVFPEPYLHFVEVLLRRIRHPGWLRSTLHSRKSRAYRQFEVLRNQWVAWAQRCRMAEQSPQSGYRLADTRLLLGNGSAHRHAQHEKHHEEVLPLPCRGLDSSDRGGTCRPTGTARELREAQVFCVPAFLRPKQHLRSM